MELSGSTYLYALATVSITFVGFSALLVVMRQAKGGGLTAYDTYFTLSFIQIGFLVSGGGLVPPMLALFDWRPTVVWRTSSALVAIPILWFVAKVPARRRAATGLPVPVFVAALLALQAAAATALLINAAIGFSRPGAVYVAAMTIVLFASGVAYLLALTVILPALGNRESTDAPARAADKP